MYNEAHKQIDNIIAWNNQKLQIRWRRIRKKPQKGGKRPGVNTAFEIPEDIYAGYCTPPEEDKNQRKVRIQKIERRWAREWG